MPDLIASGQNPHLKLLRKLARRRAREQEGAFFVEGEDLVLAGLQTDSAPRVVLVDAERPPDFGRVAISCPVIQVESTLLAEASSMAHPSRVIAIFELPEALDLATTMDRRSASGETGPWLALDGLADPGNVGTVLRTAAAFGAGGVVTLPGTADPFGPKAARASMGACFRLPVVRLDDAADVADELDAVRAAVPGLQIVALDATAKIPLWDAPLDATTLIVIGGERNGISDAARSSTDTHASLPQDPDVESVNAGVAASIALYEWTRRRQS